MMLKAMVIFKFGLLDINNAQITIIRRERCHSDGDLLYVYYRALTTHRLLLITSPITF